MWYNCYAISVFRQVLYRVRISQTLGENNLFLKVFCIINARKIPVRAGAIKRLVLIYPVRHETFNNIIIIPVSVKACDKRTVSEHVTCNK